MSSEDRRRFLVVTSVFMEVVLATFRTRLEHHYKSLNSGTLQTLQDFINEQPIKHILFHLRHRITWCCRDTFNCKNGWTLPLYHYQWNLLYTENPGMANHDCFCKYTANPVQLNDIDITLSGLILLNCCTMSQTDGQAVERLRQYKNDYLSHNNTGGITQSEFNTLWTDLKKYTLQLDPSRGSELQMIEHRPLDESLWQKYYTCLVDVQKKFEEIDSKLDIISVKMDEQTKMLQVLINKQTYDCSKNKICIQNEPYRLGQDIFTLRHQYKLKSVPNVDRIEDISGGVMQDDGRLVLCLYSQKILLICNTDGSEGENIPLQSGPWDVTAVNNSIVAVTLPWSQCIEMYNINSKLKLKSISVYGVCLYGITTINNKLVVGCGGRLSMIDDQTGKVVHKIHTDCENPVRLHTSGDRIFYRDDYNNQNMYCYSFTDDKVITLRLPSKPYSITSLQDGSLYVVCFNDSVKHVSSDVQHHKPVKTKGLKSLEDCRVISYNGTQRKLFTCDMSGNVKIFELI